MAEGIHVGNYDATTMEASVPTSPKEVAAGLSRGDLAAVSIPDDNISGSVADNTNCSFVATVTITPQRAANKLLTSSGDGHRPTGELGLEVMEVCDVSNYPNQDPLRHELKAVEQNLGDTNAVLVDSEISFRPDIHKISQVDVDQLDCDSIARLQSMLRRFQQQNSLEEQSQQLESEIGPDAAADLCSSTSTSSGMGNDSVSAAAQTPTTAICCQRVHVSSLTCDVCLADQTRGMESNSSALFEANCTAIKGHELQLPTSDDQHKEGEDVPAVTLLHTGPVERIAVGGSSSVESEEKPPMRYSHLTLLLRLQKEMARMKLEATRLQEAMRAADGVLQELLDCAFSDVQ